MLQFNQSNHNGGVKMKPTATAENRIDSIMAGWRLRVQTRMMAVGVLLTFPALVQTISRIFRHPDEWPLVSVIVIIYLGIVVLIFSTKMNINIRGWILMLLIYALGVVTMARGGLWGDGRIYLVLLPVFGVLLVNIRAGLILTVASVATYAFFGFLNHIGVLQKWIIVQTAQKSTEIWFYDGIVFAALMGTIVVVLIDFYNFLMKILSSEQQSVAQLKDAHNLLDQTNLLLEEKVEQRTSELAEANQRLHHLANHDPLTGLPNRLLFYDRLDYAISQTKHAQGNLAVVFIDLDNFKTVNDTFGHICGDALLMKIATRFKQRIAKNDMVARLSGDEFAVIFGNIQSHQDSVDAARQLLESLAEPFEIGGSSATLSASMGISVYPIDAENADELVRHADTAMYRVKHNTKGNFQFYAVGK